MSNPDYQGPPSYRRYNPLMDEWVIVSMNRLQRPWQGSQETSTNSVHVNGVNASEPINPLAPGGVRANGTTTPNYTNTYVFSNDFPIFGDEKKLKESGIISKEQADEDNSLFAQEVAYGTNRVICFHPDSKKGLVNLSVLEIQLVVKCFAAQVAELKSQYEWIQAYKEKYGEVMLVEYLNKELKKKERIVETNQYWTILVPYWAYWPYEVMILPNRHILRLDEITEEESLALAEIIKKLLIKYDNIFQCEFPYTMGWLGAPTGKHLTEDCSHWQLHAVYYPPLVRSATVKKFMGGFEMICEPQRDFVPELAADILRKQSDVHYTEAKN